MLLLVLLMKIFFNIHNTNGTLKFKVENAQNNVINIGTEKRNLYPADQSFTNTSVAQKHYKLLRFRPHS